MRECVPPTAITRQGTPNVATAEATFVAETDRTIRADRSRFVQLFENILRNAVEHGGNVTVMLAGLDDGMASISRTTVVAFLGRTVEDVREGFNLAERDRIRPGGREGDL